MRTKTITYTQDVYTYDELDEYAQQQAENLGLEFDIYGNVA